MVITASLFLSLCLTLTASAQDDDDVINIESNLIVLNVTVTDGQNAYVHGLTREDFKIYEDGTPQTITTFGVEETPFAAAILIDSSGSMEGRMTLARAAAIRFLDSLRPDDVAAVYRFDSKIEMIQDFSPSRDLAPLGYSVRARGMTVLHDAVALAAKQLAPRPEKRKAILVISDGADTQSRVTQDKALNLALTGGATIYTIDMSGEVNGSRLSPAPSLRSYANKSGGRYVPTPGGQALREALLSIAEELANQYTIGYQMENKVRDGNWRAINVKGSRANFKCRTRTGYRAPKR
jgi:VWFA-related protein